MKVVIFEDEMHNAERLISLMRQCNPDVEVLAIIESVAQGTQWLAEQHHADLMMMDIQLSDGNCFEMFTHTKVRTPVIFTTAYDGFALQAFKLNSIDYLMKPIEQKELCAALQKFEQCRPCFYPYGCKAVITGLHLPAMP